MQAYGGIGPGQTTGYMYPPAHAAPAPGSYGPNPTYTHPAQYASPPPPAPGGYRGPPYPPPVQAGYDTNNMNRPAQYAPPPGPPPPPNASAREIPAPYDTAGRSNNSNQQVYPGRPDLSPTPPEYYPHNVAYIAQNGVHVEHADTRKKWYELDEGKRNALVRHSPAFITDQRGLQHLLCLSPHLSSLQVV